ncbi:phosphatase 2C-like domain-containing protein [Mycena rebaudengoi]|nr:phosphatase 2C-like domain-containing protein [Mycena rebaudengoi]
MLWIRRTARHGPIFPGRAHYSSVQRPYRFCVAANWAGKPSDPNQPWTKPSFSAAISEWCKHSLSKFSSSTKPRTAGEDFFLCTQMRNNSGIALGVADGVGGWVSSRIDPSLFAQALMYYADGHFRNGWAGEPETDPTLEDAALGGVYEGTEITPLECLSLAHQNVLKDDAIEAGSSTGCLVTLNASSGLLRSSNLGDSGFCIIRSSSSSALFYNSPPQTHYFNCPWQIAKLPTRGRRKPIEQNLSDSPSVAQEYSTRLRDGDIVVLYTDGLSDNVFPAEIEKVCALGLKGPGSEDAKVRSIAQNLVVLSRAAMMSDRESPFELEARQNRVAYRGGKVDDVTVVVALVRETL